MRMAGCSLARRALSTFGGRDQTAGAGMQLIVLGAALCALSAQDPSAPPALCLHLVLLLPLVVELVLDDLELLERLVPLPVQLVQPPDGPGGGGAAAHDAHPQQQAEDRDRGQVEGKARDEQ